MWLKKIIKTERESKGKGKRLGRKENGDEGEKRGWGTDEDVNYD